MALTSKLTAIADAIRAKSGTSGKLTLDQMATAIASIQTGSTDVPFGFGGMNAQKIGSYDETFKLADTSFVKNSSSSTTATSILATTANKYVTATTAIGDKDIVVVQTVTATPVHGSSATNKALMRKYAICYVSHFSKRRTLASATKNTRQVTTESVGIVRYYNTSGTDAVATASYGFYATPSAPNVASTTAASTTVRVGTPVLYYRVSTSYETAANIKTVTDCTWQWHVDVYLVDKQTTTADSILSTAYDIACS